MGKNTTTYWNALGSEHRHKWEPVPGLQGIAEELTLSVDRHSGEITRLTRFAAGADTRSVGAKRHPYPEEVFIVEGRIYDAAFDQWLEAGHYASRPPGEIHGPFQSEDGCLVLEVAFPNKAERWPGPGI